MLTQEKKRTEFERIREFLAQVEIAAEVADKGKLFDDTVLLVSLPTAEEFPEDHELTEEELAIYKRGRTAKSYTSAKNASILDYRKATGLEALIGYLYLSGREERVLFLIKEGISRI